MPQEGELGVKEGELGVKKGEEEAGLSSFHFGSSKFVLATAM